MVRILLNIQHNSPFLRTMNGEVVVEYIDYRNLESAAQVKELLRCNFDYKPGSVGFKDVRGFSSYIFNGIKSQLDIMIHSYAAGMTLASHDFSWVRESENKPLTNWLQEKELEYEASYEFRHGYTQKSKDCQKVQANHKQ